MPQSARAALLSTETASQESAERAADGPVDATGQVIHAMPDEPAPSNGEADADQAQMDRSEAGWAEAPAPASDPLPPLEALQLDLERMSFFDFQLLRRQSVAFEGMSDEEIATFLLGSDWQSILDFCGVVPRPNAFFSPDLYLSLNTDIVGVNPIRHYVAYGFAELRSIGPLVDFGFVATKIPLRTDTLYCFQQLKMLMEGQALSAHPLIDPQFIASQDPSISAEDAYIAVISGAVKPPVSPHPLFHVDYYQAIRKRRFSTTEEALLDFLLGGRQPPPIYLFDREFFARQTQVPQGMDPFLHFVISSAIERAPTHPAMDVGNYIAQLEKRGLSCETHPLVHFITNGRDIGCNLLRAFDAGYYAEQSDALDRPLDHYLVHGYRNTSPNPGIDLEYVAETNRDFRLGETEILGWLYAKEPGRRPSTHSRFDPAAYLEFYDDIRNAGLCPVQHFIEWGLHEDRLPNRFFTHDYVRNALSDALVTNSAVHAYLRHGLSKRPRLLFVSHDATLTGAPAIILRLLEDFAATGLFECFSLFDADGARMPNFREASHTYVLNFPGRRYGAESREPAEEVRRLLEQLLDNKPIAAFVNSAESRHIGRAIARLGIPVITLLHEVASFYPAETFGEIYAWSTRVVLPSEYVREQAERVCTDVGGKATVRGQGLLKDSFGQLDREMVRAAVFQRLDIPPDAHLVLSCGTMDLRKGVDYFAAAAREYLTCGSCVKPTYFVWIGDGEKWANSPYFFAKEESRLYDIERFVKFIGPRSNVEPYFVAADAFLMTARADPFPCVIHEAMACGLPIIGFEKAGGAPELYGRNGRTVRYGDPGAMAEALREVLGSEETRGSLSSSARDQILRDWRSQDYFRFMLGELDALAGTRYRDEARVRDFRRPIVAVLRQGILDGRGEYLKHVQAALSGENIDCQLLRTSFASDQDARFSQVEADTDHERFANLIAVPGRSVADLVREMDASGGGLLILDASLLGKLPSTVLSPRVALGVAVTAPNELDLLATYAAAVQFVLVPEESVARSIESLVPLLGGKCHVVGIDARRPEPPSGFSGRVFISALDPMVAPLDAIRRALPLVAVARHRRPDLEVFLLCPDREGRALKSNAAENYALRDIGIVPVAGGRDLAAALGSGDIYLSVADLDTLPVGVVSAIEQGAYPMVMGQLRWLRNGLAASGLGFAFEASAIDEARRAIDAFAGGEPSGPDEAKIQPAEGFAQSIRSVLEACRRGAVARALGPQYLG